MDGVYLDIATTPSVQAAQAANGSAGLRERAGAERKTDRFTPREQAFITSRDSFYMASVSETGWPYVQHRGGPPGFLVVLDDRTLAFADFRGNRQFISQGNTAANDRVALIMVDYPSRTRLKLYARAELRALADDTALAKKLALPGYRARADWAFVLHLEAFAWNCQQHITPRFTEAEVDAALQPVRARLTALEEENAELRGRLAAMPGSVRSA